MRIMMLNQHLALMGLDNYIYSSGISEELQSDIAGLLETLGMSYQWTSTCLKLANQEIQISNSSWETKSAILDLVLNRWQHDK